MLTTIGKGLTPEALDRFDPGLVNFAITIAVLGPGYFALRSLRKGWSDSDDGKDRRRQVGILWDLGSFWPRWFHPLAPPGYGPKAVEDLSAVLKGLPDDAVVEPSPRDLSSRPSQCSNRVTVDVFLTYGSQLGILYPRMFPMSEYLTWSPKWMTSVLGGSTSGGAPIRSVVTTCKRWVQETG